MTDDFADLEDSQSRELFNIERRYCCEARKCQQAGAYLAGCVMVGAALEANLMAMVTFHPDEVAAWYMKRYPKKKKVKGLLDWNLGELLDVANELGWLPLNGMLDDDTKNWPIGAHARIIQRLRNRVHSCRSLKDDADFQFDADTLAASFNVLDGIYLHLHATLFAKMREAEQQSNS